MTIRLSNDRGHVNVGWLDSRHSFSFGDYYDPAHMGFGPLRVINDDWIAGGGGFPMHPHANMEIITYVLEGQLQHRDSLGNGSVIQAGDVQRMTAGTGIRHSEFNASAKEAVRLLQIWILPDQAGHAPGYEQKLFSQAQKQGKLCLIASSDGSMGSVKINQNAQIYASILSAGETASLELAAGRGLWVQVARGGVSVNGQPLKEGDAVSIDASGPVSFSGVEAGGEFLVFDLPLP